MRTLWHSFARSQIWYSMSVVYGFLTRTKQKMIKAMITTSIKRSIGTAENVYNDVTLALMNLSDIDLLLLLQNMKNIKKIELRFNRNYRKYIEAYGNKSYGLNYR